MKAAPRDSLERFKLARLIEELKGKRGRGTELISLYIPAGRQISDVMGMLKAERSTATNIKDRTTRHHVLDALTAVMQRLKLFRTTPPNGLVIFAGYVDTGVPGREEMEIHIIEPPERLNAYLYRCDSRFHTEIIEEMLAAKDAYALIVIDRSEAAIALLRGRSLEIVDELTSGVPGKHRAGGQSARRFERIIEQLAHEFYKRVGEHANKILLNVPDLKGIIVGGPGPTKEEFIKGDYLHYMLRDKVIAVVDIGYSGEAGVYELVRRSADILKDVEYFREKRVVQEFLEHVAKDTGLATYGVREVEDALIKGAVDTLLLSEAFEGSRVTAACSECGHRFTRWLVGPAAREGQLKCPRCGSASVEVVEKVDAAEYLVSLAESTGSRVEIISTGTEEGEELRRSFGGVAAMLRFRLQQ